MINLSPKKEIVINQAIRRLPHRLHDDSTSGTHTTRISLMSSEEPPHRRRSPKRQSSFHTPNCSANSETKAGEEENLSKVVINLYHETMATIMFWVFLPIVLPFIIFRAVIRDCLKIRRVFVLTLDCTIMQLQMIFEMITCIQHSNSSIDEKVEKMGRSFHFLNLFNPVHWIGMLLYYADHNLHHTSQAKTSLVDQGNQTTDRDEQLSPRSKRQTQGKNSGTIPVHKKTNITFKDETLVSSEEADSGNTGNSENSGNQDNESQNTRPNSTKKVKKVEFKSCDEDSSSSSNNTSGIPELDDGGNESF